jgi:hypothetical protein
MTGGRRIRLPEPVAAIYRAVKELEARYPTRRFTPDGHLVGSIGEVVAAEALGLTLYPMSQPGHDAFDANGDVQIKLTAGRSVAMYAESTRLVVLRVLSPEEAEIVYDGPGAPAWAGAGKVAKNGQRVISLARLARITAAQQAAYDDMRASPGILVDPDGNVGFDGEAEAMGAPPFKTRAEIEAAQARVETMLAARRKERAAEAELTREEYLKLREERESSPGIGVVDGHVIADRFGEQ